MQFDFSKINENTISQVQGATVTTVTTVPKNNVTNIETKVKKKSDVISIADENAEVVRLSKIMSDIKDSLNERFIERENEINMLAIAFVSSTNAFLHGKPGTGKSDLVEEFANRFVDSKYFRLLMSKTTEPSEIFGPVSINSLKNDSYKVITHNKLPEANIAFLDEVFKANSAILNGLLTIMNEKLFFNDTVESVPMVSLIGASNEFPEEDGLSALYDRFLLRWNVESIKDVNNREKLFFNFINARKSKSIVNSNNVVDNNDKKPTMSYDDLNLMIELCKKVEFDTALISEYGRLFGKLEKEGITISDRRKNEAIKVIQANAILNGRMVACLDDFEPLVYCFWEDLDDIMIIQKIIDKIANPDKEFVNNFKKSLDDLRSELDAFIEAEKDSSDFEITKAVKLTEIKQSVSYAIDKINEKIDSTVSSGVSKTLEELKGDFESFMSDIFNMLIG